MLPGLPSTFMTQASINIMVLDNGPGAVVPLHTHVRKGTEDMSRHLAFNTFNINISSTCKTCALCPVRLCLNPLLHRVHCFLLLLLWLE